ncbi:hypothetical protein [Longibacter sp.]|jgi:hypothetical protein|uniref:hypothetical protein n=1 Tax=Longibacter sp. TaxID=2045415 RepID=UPI003EBD0F91
MSESHIELRQKRSLTDVINATFGFIRANVRIIAKTLAFIVGPVAFLSLAAGLFLTVSLDISNADRILQDLSSGYILGMIGAGAIVLVVTTVAGFLLTVATVSIVRLYDEHGPGAIALDDVWGEMKTHGPTLLLIAVMVFFALVLPYPLQLIPCLGPIVYLAWALYAQTVFTITYSVCVFEQKSGWSAFQRSRELLRDHFWQSLGVYLIANFLAQILAAGASLPAGVASFIAAFFAWGDETTSQSIAVAVGAFYAVLVLVGVALLMITIIAMSFQYFNLVERREHAGLRQRVEEMADRAGVPDPVSSANAPDRRREDTEVHTETDPPVEAQDKGSLEPPHLGEEDDGDSGPDRWRRSDTDAT